MNKVALCVTCLVDQVLPEIGVATVKLLRRAGYEVDFPVEQTCCGQPFFNSGFRQQATDLAKRSIEIFEPYDVVVLPSGSCASMVIKEYVHLFEDEAWRQRSASLGEKTKELSQLLDESDWEPTSSCEPMTVTYHDSCHANRMLGIGGGPRQMLESTGCRLVEMAESDRCCGFGGLFSIKMPEVSNAMTTEKLRQALETDVDALVTVDPGCLMQMRSVREGEGPEIRHFAELLEERTR
ncbi:MAG: Fe-S oxidoreductase [Gemmatimonadetes bacterium]|nr:Fe-S oxidoreductase [Gemmatimonadota bacterium]